jgi:quinol monooxygenase YgiN
MIHVLATIEVAPGKRDDVLAQFAWVTPQVLAEDGCIEYGTAVDVATDNPNQLPPRPDVIVVVEKWRDVAALNRAHGGVPQARRGAREVGVAPGAAASVAACGFAGSSPAKPQAATRSRPSPPSRGRR